MRLFLYWRGHRSPAQKALHQSTPNPVSCELIKRFCIGSSVEGAFIPGRAAGMHTWIEKMGGVSPFFNVNLEWHLSTQAVFFGVRIERYKQRFPTKLTVNPGWTPYLCIIVCYAVCCGYIADHGRRTRLTSGHNVVTASLEGSD